LKLAPLLAEYFYANKRLDLPGIGRFLLDPSGLPEPENPRHNRSALSENIHFENDPGTKESPDLINYIASTSGKIKALASADLDSHLELARQFLNIGKPFLFEGIGTLTKLQAGTFSFIPGSILQERVKEAIIKDSTTSESTNDEEGTGFKNIFYGRKEKTSRKKTLVFLVLLGTLAVAIWGGYTIYKKTYSRNNDSVQDVVPEDVVPTSTTPAKPPGLVEKNDTLTPSPNVDPGSFRFVVEAADKTRGLQRYAQLRGFGLPVQVSTKDSLLFEIFFVLPAIAADTAKVRDSLKQLYTPAGAKAYVSR
jgi:hypothetical protein